MPSFSTRTVTVKERKKGSTPWFFVFAVLFIAGVACLIFFFNYLDEKNYGVESNATILQKVANKVEDSYINILEDLNNENVSTISKNNSLNAQVLGFEELSVIDFVNNSSTILQIINATDYITRNVNIINGFQSSFEINTLYKGPAQFMGDSTVVQMIMKKDTNGLYIKYSTNTGYKINMLVRYSYSAQSLKQIKITCSQTNRQSVMLAYNMNFETNDYYALEYYNTNIFSTELASAVVSNYNTENLTFDNMMNYPFTDVYMFKGNFKDNSKFKGYIYDYSSSTPIDDSIIAPVYNEIYGKMKNFRMYSAADSISTSINKIISFDFMSNAFEYAKNRVTLSSVTKDLKTYYAYLFLDYGDLTSVIKNVKSEIDKDPSTFTEDEIALIQSASAYLSISGRKNYVGGLGEYNGKTLTLTNEPMYFYENNKVKILSKYTLSNETCDVEFVIDKLDNFKLISIN